MMKIFAEFIKKKESESTDYLVCHKRGNKNHNFPSKAKYNEETSSVDIYEK